MKGISLIICCHNSEIRLPTTLKHISELHLNSDIHIEILIVDNASRDNTKKIATDIWNNKKKNTIKIRIVSEEQLGIGYARYKGISEATFEYICFVDDDNWLDKNYASTAYEFMENHPDVAACGSFNEAVADTPLPWWFNNFQRSYAVGPQAETPGDITETRGVLWTAGMVLRKSAVVDLLQAGFNPLVTGAKGTRKLLRSEDYELCLALRLRGWRIWYEPKLKLKHYMPLQRLSWRYLRHLLRGVGESDPILGVYFRVFRGTVKYYKTTWQYQVGRQLATLLRRPHKVLLLKFLSLEGDPEILQIERTIGAIQSLMTLRSNFNHLAERISTADWITKR